MTELASDSAAAAPATRAANATSTYWQIGLLVVLLGALFALFWPTFAAMVAIWNRSETFAHGYLILPISLYLIWHNRAYWRTTPVRTDLFALVPLALVGFGWLLARVVDILAVQQLAFVACIPLLVWLVLGRAMLWRFAFPLGFLIFMVPLGESLIYPMMQFTAAFTVHALRLTGMPVYWEGTFFSIPSGDWSVVEACSGVRYLIASIVLGCVYAYLTYRAAWRRLLFIALATIVPVIANGLRAYLIVMLAHLSGMKLAVGVDHLIYGWVFFGIVMFILFSIGMLWREPATADRAESADAAARPMASAHAKQRRPRALLATGLLGLLVLAIWPTWAGYIDRSLEPAMAVELMAPPGAQGWRPTERFTDWTPRYLGATQELQQAYGENQQPVGLHLAYYQTQQQGAELINSQNVFIEQKHPVWREPYRRSQTVELGEQTIAVQEAELVSDRQTLLAWRWYWINGEFTTHALWAKWLEAKGVLLGQGRSGAGIIVYTPMAEERAASRRRLQTFVAAMLGPIRQRLAQADKDA